MGAVPVPTEACASHPRGYVCSTTTQIRFAYPQSWHALTYTTSGLLSRSMIYLSTAPLHDPCTRSTRGANHFDYLRLASLIHRPKRRSCGMAARRQARMAAQRSPRDSDQNRRTPSAVRNEHKRYVLRQLSPHWRGRGHHCLAGTTGAQQQLPVRRLPSRPRVSNVGAPGARPSRLNPFSARLVDRR